LADLHDENVIQVARETHGERLRETPSNERALLLTALQQQTRFFDHKAGRHEIATKFTKVQLNPRGSLEVRKQERIKSRKNKS